MNSTESSWNIQGHKTLTGSSELKEMMAVFLLFAKFYLGGRSLWYVYSLDFPSSWWVKDVQ